MTFGKTFPSENDRFTGLAKRMGELQVEAYRIEYDWEDIFFVRPANVYGTCDNFDLKNTMVIPSLIKSAMDGENPFVVWGYGSPIRGFIHTKDVARGMVTVFEKSIRKPVNLGSGVGVNIKEIVGIIVQNLETNPEIVWDISKPAGDKKRLMEMSRARFLDLNQESPLRKVSKRLWNGIKIIRIK